MHDLERAGIEIVNIIDDARHESSASNTIVEFRQPDSAGEAKRGQKK
jgi:hypothetical protein